MKIVYFSCFISSFYLLTGCVSANSNDVILQKSADPTPSWLKENGKINTSNPEYVNLVFTKSDLYNLPLGLKQSQTIATQKISRLVLSEVQKQLLNRIEKLNSTKKISDVHTISTSISNIINRFSTDFKVSPPLAEQVYWEYRQQEHVHESKQFYVVWVLLLIPKTVYDKAFITIAHELQNSKDAVAVTLGNEILQK